MNECHQINEVIHNKPQSLEIAEREGVGAVEYFMNDVFLVLEIERDASQARDGC